ncbi:RipA family octameric membrane protein [Streptomyces sp. NBC_01451]|uniref:RipA family octameric membrane protein n=1 Tax=Streptomyces sp. NBC_01451 TaxID=2903872 RepID=UPI002E321340|nr:hypothetical protein [Streptomyces sp. NBC_01451]
MSTPEDDEQRRAEDARLWEQVIYEGGMVFQIGNVFLLAESLLIVAYTALLSSGSNNGPDDYLPVLRVLAAFGLVTSGSWFYMAHRQLRFARRVERRAEDRLPDYADTVSYARASGMESKLLLAYLIPVVAGIMWTLFMVFA